METFTVVNRLTAMELKNIQTTHLSYRGYFPEVFIDKNSHCLNQRWESFYDLSSLIG
jgi:hypothetical protein